MPEKPVIKIENVRKTFRVGTQDVEVLKGVSFDIGEGDFLLIFGPSGCGKSTMLHTILGLEPPTSGTVRFFDKDYYSYTTEDDRSIFRKKNVGMVYQQTNWIRALNVRENVAFPLTLLGISKHEAFTRAQQILKDLGMEGWSEYTPTELSSGQQQRIALARALVNDPAVIVADEPTGNLDFKSGEIVMGMLADMNKAQKKTIIMVTHDLEYLKFSTRIVKMFDGTVEGIYDGDERQQVIDSVYLKRGVMKNEGVDEASEGTTEETTTDLGSTDKTDEKTPATPKKAPKKEQEQEVKVGVAADVSQKTSEEGDNK